MDLESWTPKDKARRMAVLIALYLATMLMVVSVLALKWPWFVIPLVGIAGYAVVYFLAYAVLRNAFHW